jgi:hypothetical protein
MSPCLCLLLGHCCLRTKHSTYNKQCQATASLGTTLSIAISFYQCNSLSKIKFFTTHKAKNEGRGVRPTRFEFRHPSALTPLQAPKVLSIPLWRYTGTGYLICGRPDPSRGEGWCPWNSHTSGVSLPGPRPLLSFRAYMRKMLSFGS